MYLSITAVKALSNFELLLTFENNEQRIFDMNPHLSTGIFSELKNESVYKSVKLQFDSIEWSNGADIDPELLYSESKPLGKHSFVIAS